MDGNWTCPTCGNRTFAVIHSCPGVPQHPTLSVRVRAVPPPAASEPRQDT